MYTQNTLSTHMSPVTNRLRNRILTRLTRIEKGGILTIRIGSIGDCKLVAWNVEARFYVSKQAMMQELLTGKTRLV
jgi:hypothetical protein